MSQKKHEPWRNVERHYCAYCNAWMGSDRQSILIHENGKKHKEAVEANLKKRRDEKLQEEKDQNEITKSLKLMEAAAIRAHAADVALGAFAPSAPSNAAPLLHSSMLQQQESTKTINTTKVELKSWHDRKEKRKTDDTQIHEVVSKVKRKKLDFDGHHKIGENIYLSGEVYAPIFEEDIPVQIWIGSPTTNMLFRQSQEASQSWRTGFLIRVYKPTVSRDEIDAKDVTCDVTYLKDIADEDETIEKKVSSDRIRLILGSDDSIPKSVEEARLSLLGEEVIHYDHGADAEIDENTGLSSWGTVSVRKVTVSQQVQEERARMKAKRLEDLEKEKMKEKEANQRRMEEAKHAGADDSALGAYDVWSTSTKGGYKGVNIHKESKLEVTDFAKSLSKGKVDVKFKSVAKKGKTPSNINKKKMRRVTTSDSEGE
jgi:WW domain-binding protein 4